MKRLLPFLLMLVLVACDKGDDSNNDVIPNNPDAAVCLLNELTFDDSHTITGDLIKSKYTYDASGKITKIEDYLEGVAQGYWTLTYDTKGNIVRKDFYNNNHTHIRRFTFEYDANNLQTEAIFYRLTDGNLLASFIWRHEYDSPTQLKKSIALQPEHNRATQYTYEYKDGLIHKVHLYDEFSQFNQTTELAYDENKHPAATNKVLLNSFFNPQGYPFKHNITKATVIAASSGTTPYVSHTVAFVYNEYGFPTEEVRTNQNGNKSTYTYNYQCK